MKNKIFKTIIAISVSVLFIIAAVSCAAKFIYLSPSCYSDNDTLTNQENYFIKKNRTGMCRGASFGFCRFK